MMPGETIASGAAPRCQTCGVETKLEVLRSPAGWYIGTRCGCGPYTRESVYYRTEQFARTELASGDWVRRT